jgi:hypothetical protein
MSTSVASTDRSSEETAAGISKSHTQAVLASSSNQPSSKEPPTQESLRHATIVDPLTPHVPTTSAPTAIGATSSELHIYEPGSFAAEDPNPSGDEATACDSETDGPEVDDEEELYMAPIRIVS